MAEAFSKREQFMQTMSSTHFPYCHDVVEKYEALVKIGEGSYGEVLKARHRETGELVALKKVLVTKEDEGFPITTLREIKILQRLKHENIIKLIEVCRKKGTSLSHWLSTFYLVFDFCEHDLSGLLRNATVKFSLGEIKMVLKQLFKGLFFIHVNKLMHGNLKPSNILITKEGKLKIADSGFAISFDSEIPERFYEAVTLWYKPPEILKGVRNYTPSVDMWSAGCVMAEMWTRNPILQGESRYHQLKLIRQHCGVITTETFPGCENIDLLNQTYASKDRKPKKDRRPNEESEAKRWLKDCMKDPHAIDLLDKLLTFDPAQRIDSDKALTHDFFWTDPLPRELTMLQPDTQSI